MKAIITKDVEVRGDRETPKINISMSLSASKEPQNLPSWAVHQAERMGAAKIVKPKAKKSEAKPASDEDG